MAVSIRLTRTGSGPKRQLGVSLLLVVLLLMLGVGLFGVTASQESIRAVLSDKKLGVGLNEAKEALVAYGVAHPTRPGALPCPAMNLNGIAEPLDVTGACPSYLGLLPWRTLGIGDVRDESGELYWYALSQNFRNFVTINSDTKGTRTVFSGSPPVTVTAEAVAVLFSPGGVIEGQTRNDTVALCPSTGTAIANKLCAANYLDTAAGVNNGVSVPPGLGPFITVEPSSTFNDRLVVLRTSDLIPIVERRIAAEIRETLLDYRAASRDAITGNGCNCYPWADSDGDGDSDVGNNHGRVPLTRARPHNWGTTLKDAGGILYTLPTLPPYFQTNRWHEMVYYAVGRNALQNLGLNPTPCDTCSGDPLLAPPPVLLKGSLSVDKSIGHAVILITPGSAGANRPGATFTWGNYIDDGMNRDKDDRFVTPTSKSFDRDRILTLPDDVPPASCRPNAQILIRNAPCQSGSKVKKICEKTVSNLNTFNAGIGCSCSGEATRMITANNLGGCLSSLRPATCQAAIAALQVCK